MNVPDTALVDLMRNIHALMHELDAAAFQLQKTRETLGRSAGRSGRHFHDFADSLLGRLRSVKDAGRNVFRASRLHSSGTAVASNPARFGGRPLDILWVDDDEMHLSSLGGYFQDAKWRMTQTTTVDEALTLVTRRDFDAVLVDLIMPAGTFGAEETAGGRLTGLALSRRIRDQHPTWPIVFLTVADSPEVSKWCRDNPPATVLFKPQLASDTVRKVEALIRYQTDSSLDDLESMLERFPPFARAITRRHDNRPGLEVSDEYDVQDLLRAILVLRLQDIREEEWSPSYAGGSSRIDFVLPRSGMAIEVKMTRPGLKLKQLGEQLLVDIARYKAHPDVRALVCFVVDAANVVVNEVGFVEDLRSASSPELEVRAVVVQLGLDDTSRELLSQGRSASARVGDGGT